MHQPTTANARIQRSSSFYSNRYIHTFVPLFKIVHFACFTCIVIYSYRFRISSSYCLRNEPVKQGNVPFRRLHIYQKFPSITIFRRPFYAILLCPLFHAFSNVARSIRAFRSAERLAGDLHKPVSSLVIYFLGQLHFGCIILRRILRQIEYSNFSIGSSQPPPPLPHEFYFPAINGHFHFRHP